MASLRKTRELLCISHAMGFITDAEFLLLYKGSRSDTDFPTKSIRPDKNGAECTANLRVEKHLRVRVH